MTSQLSQSSFQLSFAQSERIAEFLAQETRRRLEGGPDQSPIRFNKPSKRFMVGTLFPPSEFGGREADVRETEGDEDSQQGSDEDADLSAALMGSRRVRPQRMGLFFYVAKGAGIAKASISLDVWRRLEVPDGSPETWEFCQRVEVSGPLDIADPNQSAARLTDQLNAALSRAADRAAGPGAIVLQGARVPETLRGPVRPPWKGEVAVRVEIQGGEIRVSLELINRTEVPGFAPLRSKIEPALFRPIMSIDLSPLGSNLRKRVPAEFRVKSKRRQVFEPLGHGIGCVAEEEPGPPGVLRSVMAPIYRQPFLSHTERPGTNLAELQAEPHAAAARFHAAMIAYLPEWETARALCAGDPEQLAEFEKDFAVFQDECARVGQCVQMLHPQTGDKNVRTAFEAVLATFVTMNQAREAARKRGTRSKDPLTGLRPFQLGYVLSAIPDIVARAQARKRRDPDLVLKADLIWFPTGGGKTEAFQALGLFCAFHDRLEGKVRGMSCWLRFALRALTVQQTNRLLELIWHAEKVRKQRRIGPANAEFRLGLLVGEAYTPTEIIAASNRATDRSKTRHAIEKVIADKNGEGYLFTPNCPECHTSMVRSRFDESAWDIVFGCTSPGCGATALPLTVVDDAIRRRPPAFVVGTIDKVTGLGLTRKFHSLMRSPVWECKTHGAVRARRKSKKDPAGAPTCPMEAPQLCGLPLVETDEGDWGPTVEVTDEVHLLEEELGAFAAHYESALHHIQRMGRYPPPKVVLASATVAGYEKHVEELTALQPRRFPSPPPTQLAGFWYEIDMSRQRRTLMGIHPHGLTESNALMFTLRALHSALRDLADPSSAMPLDKLLNVQLTTDERLRALRPYATSITYILALKQGDNVVNSLNGQMPDIMKEISQDTLRPSEIISSRLDAPNLTRLLSTLEDPSPQTAYDVVPASSSIAYGVDIQNINTMVLLGQPRRTSEDVQVTSRTARFYSGLVIRLYHPVRERDQTHYRLFFQYHRNQDLLVESVPVNRFSTMSARRTLPGIMMGLLFATDEDRRGEMDAWFADGARKILQKPAVHDRITRAIRSIYGVGKGHDAFDRQVEACLSDNLTLIRDQDAAPENTTRDRLTPTPMRSLRDIDPGIEFIHQVKGVNPTLVDQSGISNQMTRSRVQVVYGHTPMAVYDYQGGLRMVQTTFVKGDDLRGSLDAVDIRAILARIWHVVREIPSIKALGGAAYNPDTLADKFELVRPGTVFVKLYPYVLRCPSCEHVWAIKLEQDDLRCPQCAARRGGAVPRGVQLRHVAIHTCGKIEPIRVQRCPTHPNALLRLNSVSQQVAGWRWQCGLCAWNEMPFQSCFNCGRDDDGGAAGAPPAEGGAQ